jgi:hypothetical protein
MTYGRRCSFEAVREAAFGAIGAAYATIGGVTTDYTRIISIFNSTDADVYISLDGVTNHLRVASGTGQVLDLTANKVRDDGLFIKLGTQFYQKRAGGAPSVGNVWIQTVSATGGV